MLLRIQHRNSCFSLLQDKQTVVLPRRPDSVSRSSSVKISILKTLEFSSQTLRSGVVVQSQDGPRGSALLFLRGAPAVIRGLLDPSSVPANFDQVFTNISCITDAE